MKKVLTILIVAIILASGMQVSLDRHYCGGRLIDVRISVTGKMASCGMEDTEESCPVQGNHLKSHCCDDVVTIYNIDNNYTRSYPVLPETSNSNFQIFGIPATLTGNYKAVLTVLNTDVSPPGYLMSTDVDLSCICVFRI